MNKREQNKYDKLYHKFLQFLRLQGYSKASIDGFSVAFVVSPNTLISAPTHAIDDLKQYFKDLLETHSWSTIKLDRKAFSTTGCIFSARNGIGC